MRRKWNTGKPGRRILTPDYRFADFTAVTPEFLRGLGVRAVLSDLDNTLAPYEMPEPDERIRAWIASLREAGIALALVSNNHADRVERFNRTLGLPVFPDVGKPKRKGLRRAMAALGVDANETAMLGDQLLTDVLAGSRLGCLTLLVPPIKDKTTAFFRFKRALEKPFLRRYERLERKWERERGNP